MLEFTILPLIIPNQDPIPLSGIDDGALDPDLAAHDEICQRCVTSFRARVCSCAYLSLIISTLGAVFVCVCTRACACFGLYYSYRNPNEPRDMQMEARCPFIDTDTSWIFKEVRSYAVHNLNSVDLLRTS